MSKAGRDVQHLGQKPGSPGVLLASGMGPFLAKALLEWQELRQWCAISGIVSRGRVQRCSAVCTYAGRSVRLSMWVSY